MNLKLGNTIETAENCNLSNLETLSGSWGLTLSVTHTPITQKQVQSGRSNLV